MTLITDTICNQQETALEIILKLKTQFGNAVVAGGAPRDWYMGQIARDIDVYVVTPPKKAAILLATATVALGEEVKHLGKEYEYLEQSGIGFITAGLTYINSQSVNIIFLNENYVGKDGNVYDHFDCDICQIAWDGDFITTEQFIDAWSSDTITFNKFEEKHLKKMIYKFKGWKFKFNI